VIRLTVVRHGETEFNALGLIGDNSLPEKFMDHLSEKGKLQAIEVANQLGGRKFDVVILSPFVRTRETLELFLRSF
jgi:broad specificity phosphatase PhoE